MGIKSEEQFIEIVLKAERESKQNLAAYKVKLTLFALLGYVVIFSMLTTLVGLIGGVIGLAVFSSSILLLLIKKKIIFGILFVIWTLFRALWVKIEPIQGYKLKRDEYPELYLEIDELTKRLDALKIHQVILDRSLNAAVIQRPRLGIFGWYENSLVLGLQLLLTLSPDEMRSVLAHEFGHLSGNHSRFSGWIYRIRLSWQHIMNAFGEKNNFGASLMRRFFNWYSPQFSAYSFALARNNEYEADGIAAQLTSADVATQALVSVHVTAPYIESHYWGEYFKQADEHSQPLFAPFEGLKNFLRDNSLALQDMQKRLDEELAIETHYADTHPSLKDRVMALGVKIQCSEVMGENAAEKWLGARYHTSLSNFDQEWLSENEEAWKSRHDYVVHAKDQLGKYAGSDIEKMNDDDLWSYAYWTYEFIDGPTALPLFQAYQLRKHDDGDAAFHLGCIVLAQEDHKGLQQLALARKYSHLAEDAAKIGYDFLIRNNLESDAEKWWQESIADFELHQLAWAERAEVKVDDVFEIAQLNDLELKHVIDQLSKHAKIKKAWIAKKIVQYQLDDPVYVIVFAPKGFYLSYEAIQKEIAECLDINIRAFVVCKHGNTKKLAKKIIKNAVKII